MKLQHAKLCLDCETIFSKGKACPSCGRDLCITRLSNWVPSLIHMEPDPAPELTHEPGGSFLGRFLGFFNPFIQIPKSEIRDPN